MPFLETEDEILKAAAYIQEKRRADRTQDQAESLGRLHGAETPALALVRNEDIVRHHSPDERDIDHIMTIRAAALNFLNAIDANCPRCADTSVAKRHVRDAMMTANAAIVLKGAV